MSADFRPFLDRPIARFCAVGVVFAVAGVLLAIHWDDLFGESGETIARGNPELAACLDKRVGDVETMLDNGTINERQAEEFRRRAEDYCRAQFGTGGGPPAGAGGNSLGLQPGLGN